MDIVEKLNRILMDTTCHAQGSVDISQGPYGSNIMGMRYRKKKKKMKGGAEYAMHEEKNFKVTVIVKSKKYKKTFNVKAPDEWKARTRAINMAFNKGLKLAGDQVDYQVSEGKYWPGHPKWDPYHGTGVKPPKPTLQNKMSRDKDISAIKSFIEKQRTWFDIEEVSDGFILLSTREHGDVGSGRPGKEDQKEGIRLGKLIKQKFKTVDIDLDGFDEWVHLEIRL
jgi:hypothetical protein